MLSSRVPHALCCFFTQSAVCLASAWRRVSRSFLALALESAKVPPGVLIRARGFRVETPAGRPSPDGCWLRAPLLLLLTPEDCTILHEARVPADACRTHPKRCHAKLVIGTSLLRVAFSSAQTFARVLHSPRNRSALFIDESLLSSWMHATPGPQ